MPEPQKKSVLIDLAPFRASRPFTYMWIGALVTGIGNLLTSVAVGLHIYDLTGSTFMVSLVGVIALIPTMVAGLWGGGMVDRHDRRLVALGAAMLAWTSTLVIALLAWTGHETVWSLYLLSALNAVGAGLASSSRSAMVPSLVPADLLPAAGALNGMSMGIVLTTGPALAGLLVGRVGYAWTYSLDVLLFCGSFLGLWALPAMRPETTSEHKGLAAIKESARFIARSPVVAMSFVVDIIAMTFGNPRSLFPAVGAVAVGGGPLTAGILAAASAVGAIVCSGFSGRIVTWRRHGRAVNLAIIAYGAFAAGFGLVLLATITGRLPGGVGTLSHTNHGALWASIVMLVGMGASDNVSAIFRNTILLQAVPDSIRGRMQGIYIMVVTGGPRVGDAFVGVAALAAVWAPPLIGGLVIMAAIAALVRLVPAFHRYEAGAQTRLAD